MRDLRLDHLRHALDRDPRSAAERAAAVALYAQRAEQRRDLFTGQPAPPTRPVAELDEGHDVRAAGLVPLRCHRTTPWGEAWAALEARTSAGWRVGR